RRGPALCVARSAHAPGEHRLTARQLRRHGLGIVGLLIAALALVVALAAPWLAPHDPVATDFAAGLKPPGTPGHPLGTDQLGRDLLSRVLYGARIALFIGFCTVLVTAVVGGLLGLLAGFIGGLPGALGLLIAGRPPPVSLH